MPLTYLARIVVASLIAFAPLGAAAEPAAVRWPDVTLLDGRVLKASELNGRTVVVEFWASWCPFCARQNPYIEALHRAHGGKGLIVLTFTVDRTDAPARDYLQRHGYTFAAARSTPEIEAALGGRRVLPEVIVVDAKGRIVFRDRGEMFEEEVAALARFASP
jgi:thiol-disulfide isomerase/thioredoxin